MKAGILCIAQTFDRSRNDRILLYDQSRITLSMFEDGHLIWVRPVGTGAVTALNDASITTVDKRRLLGK